MSETLQRIENKRADCVVHHATGSTLVISSIVCVCVVVCVAFQVVALAI